MQSIWLPFVICARWDVHIVDSYAAHLRGPIPNLLPLVYDSLFLSPSALSPNSFALTNVATPRVSKSVENPLSHIITIIHSTFTYNGYLHILSLETTLSNITEL